MSAVAVTPFQERVYRAVSRVPRGRVTTYARLAEATGCRSPRAIGQALKRNPFAPQVPCHRVIASDLSPGGYAGQCCGPKLAQKLALLDEEGVHFRAGRLADPACVY